MVEWLHTSPSQGGDPRSIRGRSNNNVFILIFLEFFMKKLTCPTTSVRIPVEREIVLSDALKHNWPNDSNGYFLVKIENGLICCGFVDKQTHVMKVEFRGANVNKMIQEIAERKLCDHKTMGYIASELMIAKNALENNKRYIQR